MAEKDYYLILPLLLYGLAISDLVSSWRSFFFSERRYWPYIPTSLLLLEASFWNFYRMNKWMTIDSFENYLSYSPFIITPLVFIVVVAVFTPDKENEDIKTYFQSNMRIIFGGLAIFVALHFLFAPPFTNGCPGTDRKGRYDCFSCGDSNFEKAGACLLSPGRSHFGLLCNGLKFVNPFTLFFNRLYRVFCEN